MATRRKPYYDEKNRVWTGAVYLGRDDLGKVIRRKGSAATFDAALAKLEKLEQKLASGALPSRPDKILTGQWLENWLETTSRPKVNLDTYELYRGLVQNHLVPHIGKTPLQKLAPLHLDQLFATLEKRGVGRRTQQLVHIVLGQALKKAAALEVIGKSPLTHIPKPPLDRKKVKRKQTWTVDDVQKFLAAASSDRLSALYVLAVATGMRQSELLGLLWECVDLDVGFLRVEWSLHEVRKELQTKIDPRVGAGLELRPPKTEASRRALALPRLAIDALRALKDSARAPSPFVFTTVHGEPIRARTFSDDWKALLKAAKTPFLEFKQLRHTCLTLLAEEGVPLKAAQALAGHSTPQLTAAVYQQATERLARQAADTMDRVLGRRRDD